MLCTLVVIMPYKAPFMQPDALLLRVKPAILVHRIAAMLLQSKPNNCLHAYFQASTYDTRKPPPFTLQSCRTVSTSTSKDSQNMCNNRYAPPPLLPRVCWPNKV
jgi:hypothetical protein